MWEHICTIPVSADDALTEITQDLGAEYKKILITMNKNSAGGLVNGSTDSYMIDIYGDGTKIGRAPTKSAEIAWSTHWFIAEWIGRRSIGIWYTDNVNGKNESILIGNQNAGIRAVLEAVRKIGDDAKDARIAEQDRQILRYQFLESQSAQNAYLIGQLRPSPIPSYRVPNPYCCNPCDCNGGW